MGKGASKVSQDLEQVDGDGNATITRAIARGRVYIILRYPREVETLEDTSFSDDQFRELLADVQKSLPDFEITLDAGRVDRFVEHMTFYNNSDPSKDTPRPRVLVEVYYTGVWAGIDRDMIKKAVALNVDPNGQCFIDLRFEMGRYHTTPHLETLLRI